MLRILILFCFIINISFSNTIPVSLKLNWKHQFQFAGFYIAKEKGFYKEKNLHVKISEYDNVSVVDDVLSGKYDFAIGKSSLIIDKANNKDIALIAALFQHSPSVLITTNPNIKRPADVKNKRVMATLSQITSISLKAMLASEGVKKENFILQEHSYNVQDLIDNKTDVMASYLSNEPYVLEKKRIPFTILNPIDYGLSFYGDILFSSSSFLKNNPKVSKDFYDASIKGWLYAYENIEESAKIIYEKYNSQNKSLDELIYEGEILKALAFDENNEFGRISKVKFNNILKIYKLFRAIPQDYEIKNFIDPFGFSKKDINIAILAKRGKTATNKRWEHIPEILNERLPKYNFKILPVAYDEVDEVLREEKADFIFLNTALYLQMAYKHKIAKLATLKRYYKNSKIPLSSFGSVIFTTKDNKNINYISDVKNKKVAAVHQTSFGGWLIAKEELQKNNILEEDIELSFLGEQDAVVKAILNKSSDVGIVRTDILETMQEEGILNLDDIKIINQKFHKNFFYLVSTTLYPEWPFAKLQHTNETLAYKVLSTLIEDEDLQQDIYSFGWTIPKDYSRVNTLLKKLKMFPYDKQKITLADFVDKYKFQILIFVFILLIILIMLIYTKRTNNYLKNFNKMLERKVKERTKQLRETNKKLKFLAHTDELTQINNRRSFLNKLTTYIDISQRDDSPLSLLSLDIDHFKHINDTYGHHMGDEVLRVFAKTVSKNLRKVDIFGRIGGEEFAICLHNTTIKDAQKIAEKIRENIYDTYITTEQNQKIHVSVSIGLVELEKDMSINALIKMADEAMYKAKQNGRNQVCTLHGSTH